MRSIEAVRQVSVSDRPALPCGQPHLRSYVKQGHRARSRTQHWLSYTCIKDILPNTERKPVLRRANRAMNPRLWGRRQFGGFRLGVILVRAEILAAVPLTRDELRFVR